MTREYLAREFASSSNLPVKPLGVLEVDLRKGSSFTRTPDEKL